MNHQQVCVGAGRASLARVAITRRNAGAIACNERIAGGPQTARLLVAAGLAAGLGVLAAASVARAQTPLRVAVWNVTNYSSTLPSTRDNNFQTAVYGQVPAGLLLAGQRMAPDVLVLQEILSASALANFRNIMNSAPGSPGDWVAAPFRASPDTAHGFLFRSSRVQLLDRFGAAVPVANLANPASPTGNAVNAATIIAFGSSSTCNQPRNTVRYDMRPFGYTAAGSSVGVYSIHLKAQGPNNGACTNAAPNNENSAGRRLVETQRIRANAAGIPTGGPGTGLPAGYHYMVAGDTNIQASTDAEYQAFVAASTSGYPDGSNPPVFIPMTISSGRFVDPIRTPGTWNNNGTFRVVHTQDPATQVDDRFDQILLSPSLVDGAGFDYRGNPNVAYRSFNSSDPNTWNDPNHSYRSWGNDGFSFNAVLRTTGNTMVGQAIAQALVSSAAGNGHLPVFLELRVPPKVGVNTLTVNFGSVVRGTPASAIIDVSNAADLARWSADGIGTLTYSLSASAGFTAPPGFFSRAAADPALSHTLTMDTSTSGNKSGTLTISAPQATDTPTLVVQLIGVVTDPAPTCVPDYNADGVLNTDDISDYITDYFTNPPVPGPGGYAQPCPAAPAPYATQGYKVDINADCVVNTDDISDYITAYFQGC